MTDKQQNTAARKLMEAMPMRDTPWTDVDAIVAGLSSYEKAAMQSRILFISKRDGLVAKGLLTNDGGRQWTTLGLAVRAKLGASNG